MYRLLRAMMRLAVSVYLGRRFTASGQNLVPAEGGLLVCANHRSTIDPPLVPAFLPRRRAWSLAKVEYFQGSRFTAWLFRSYGAIPVARHRADRRAVRRVLDLLRAGEALVVYPEGTRVREGGMIRAEPGAGFFARSTGVAVQPVGLIGTRECFPTGAHWPRRVRVEVRFGPPFHIRSRRPDGRPVKYQEAVDAIMLAIAELLPTELRGDYSDLDGLRAELAGVIQAPPGIRA
ncbi:MAG: 1-acyl-sn-glycerol-3-phosphate acyltransferase [Candidatus Dormibacteraeota bacterium]|uniref:1-acyl-sn-glycerol-3-phosphate acyltransferase n=1 Tax=Candidatus Dormiibacter inghamiae TaxID=3127013 RepID=A0A934KBR9_9BACT|nr:1-acyl-sn-glycerol-3-phosphate acyltransferase [Candidatus Dormibacteraeota bacterium]MBJ7607469.1 1-acyl-sn-glycerol-3-phosphate acyltransferase [Candidatus Dormibacteraeota bacterium]